MTYIIGVVQVTDKGDKNFWDRFAKLYAPFMKKDQGLYDEVCKYLSLI